MITVVGIDVRHSATHVSVTVPIGKPFFCLQVTKSFFFFKL